MGRYIQTLQALTPLPPPLHGYGMVRHTPLPFWLKLLAIEPTYGRYLARLLCARAIGESTQVLQYNTEYSVASAIGSTAPVSHTGCRKRPGKLQHPLTVSWQRISVVYKESTYVVYQLRWQPYIIASEGVHGDYRTARRLLLHVARLHELAQPRLRSYFQKGR